MHTIYARLRTFRLFKRLHPIVVQELAAIVFIEFLERKVVRKLSKKIYPITYFSFSNLYQSLILQQNVQTVQI